MSWSSLSTGRIQTDNCWFCRMMLSLLLELLYFYSTKVIWSNTICCIVRIQVLVMVMLSRLRSNSRSLCGQGVPRGTPDLCPLPGAQGWDVGAHYTESAGRRKQEAVSQSPAALPDLAESSYTSNPCLLQPFCPPLSHGCLDMFIHSV